jgi:hypothetical protein
MPELREFTRGAFRPVATRMEHGFERVRSRMAKAKRKGGKSPGETRDAKAERIYATAMAIIETDTESTQAKTEP